MNRIVVTPAGRKRYLELLFENLKKCKDEFDKWVIWVNTNNAQDIEYMKLLESENDFIELQYSEFDVDPNDSHTGTICNFFKKCIDVNSVYLRLDDDIIYIHKNSIKDLFDFRIKNEQYFLVYGNILNNAIVSYLYQKNNIIGNTPLLTYDCLDNHSWRNPQFAYNLHNVFLEKFNENKILDFFIDNWELKNFERVSINSICWLGKTFSLFGGNVGVSEETWLSTDKPQELNQTSIIFGKSLFCHYAFAPQRNFLESTDILDKYSKITI